MFYHSNFLVIRNTNEPTDMSARVKSIRDLRYLSDNPKRPIKWNARANSEFLESRKTFPGSIILPANKGGWSLVRKTGASKRMNERC